MNQTLKTLFARRSIRKFQLKQIAEAELEQILLAGLYAPSAGSRQSVVFAVCQNEEINRLLGRCNAAAFPRRPVVMTNAVSKDQPSIADDPNLKNGFYDAPTVITLFAPKEMRYSAMDCAVAAENLMLAAQSLEIGSCLVGRAEETFEGDLGQETLAKWGISAAYQAFVHVALGYPLDNQPVQAKPRKEARITRI